MNVLYVALLIAVSIVLARFFLAGLSALCDIVLQFDLNEDSHD